MFELRGSIVPLVTPLTHQREVDYPALEKLLAWHNDASTQGLIILGSTGEGNLLTEEERAEVIDFVINASNHTMPVWVGVNDTNPDRVLKLIHQAADLGAEGVMVPSPMYVKPSQAGIISYFTHLADASPIGLMMYNVPSRTGSTIDIETACILSHHEQIIGIKDCQISVDGMAQYQNAAHHFEVYCGNDRDMLVCLENGGAGVISVIGNLLPELVRALYELSVLGVHHKSAALDSRWQQLIGALERMSNPAAIKWAMSERGIISPYTRLPLSPLNFEEEAVMTEALEDLAPLWTFNPDYDVS